MSAVHCCVCYCTTQRLNISSNTAFSNMQLHDLYLFGPFAISPHNTTQLLKKFPSSGTLKLTNNHTKTHSSSVNIHEKLDKHF